MSASAEQQLRYVSDVLMPTIKEYGHAVQGVFPVEGDPLEVPWVYSVGLGRRGWPELVITGMDPRQGVMLVNMLVEWFDTHQLTPAEGMNLDGFLEDDMPSRLRRVQPDSDMYPLTMAMLAAENEWPDALQWCWPDDDRHLPGDPLYNGERFKQPLLPKEVRA